MLNTQLIIESLSKALEPLGKITAYNQTFNLHYKLDPYFTKKGKLHFYIRLELMDAGYPEPWAILSCRNEPYEDQLNDLEFFVKDWSENESWVDQMLKFPVFRDTGKVVDGLKVWELIPCEEPFHDHHDGCPSCTDIMYLIDCQNKGIAVD